MQGELAVKLIEQVATVESPRLQSPRPHVGRLLDVYA
jgi:hypothetical protein